MPRIPDFFRHRPCEQIGASPAAGKPTKSEETPQSTPSKGKADKHRLKEIRQKFLGQPAEEKPLLTADTIIPNYGSSTPTSTLKK